MKHPISSKVGQQEGLNLLHYKLIAKVTLFTSLSAALILLILLFAISTEGEGSYIDIIQAHTVTRLQLGSSILIAALLVLITVGISVWLISLYSSFRIAGPLYRLIQNLQAAMTFGQQNRIRHDDALQNVAQELHETIEHLEKHYRHLHSEVDEIITKLGKHDVEAANASLKRLKAIEAKVQLDD